MLMFVLFDRLAYVLFLQQNNWTALTIAASRNHLRIANLLLIKGANRNDIIDPNEVSVVARKNQKTSKVLKTLTPKR